MNRSDNWRLPLRQSPAHHDSWRLPLQKSSNDQTARPRSKAPCKFFARGACRNGETCTFSHDTGTSQEETATASVGTPTQAKDSRSEVPCHFFLKGSCRNGNLCPFAHPRTETGAGAPPVEHNGSEKAEEDKPDNWIREIYGAVAQFGDGAAVLKASLQSDFSAVRLTMLPLGSSPASISALLDQLDIQVAPDCIRMPPQEDADYCIADICVEDPSFANRLCTAVDSKSAQIDGDIPLKAVQINAPMPRGSNSHRVECKKVYLSWHRPRVKPMVFLDFKDKLLAQRFVKRFKAETLLVLGQNIKISWTIERTGNLLSRPVWRVSLTNVPSEATVSDIIRPTPLIDVVFEKDYCNLVTANALIKSKLMQVGPLEWWEDAPTLGGKRAKAKARFRDEGDAAKAGSLLNDSPLPFDQNGKLTVQPVFSARFKVQNRLYRVIETRVWIQRNVWASKHLVFIPYEPVRGYRVLKLEGTDNSLIAEAKHELEKILEGELAIIDDKILWTPSFAVNGNMYRKVKALEGMLGIIIVRNKRKSRLHLYGSPEDCHKAMQLLARIVKEGSSTARVIELDQQKFFWACSGGFKEIAKKIGQKVVIDVISNPKRILVTGSEKDYQVALAMVTNQKEVSEIEPELPTAGDCAICWTDAENPIHTKCKHTYCSDCFERCCFSSDSGNNDFYITCEGDLGNCKTVFTLEELQEHLSFSALDDLLETSFKSHVRRRPETFHYCPKPDCGQVYRSSTSGIVFTCSKCLTTVCTSCDVDHQGKTCAEHKDIISGGYAAVEETKKRLGIKDCPKCKTSMEKTDGCDHMVCEGCKTHICWKCMATFKVSSECYAHMRREHGSIGIDI